MAPCVAWNYKIIFLLAKANDFNNLNQNIFDKKGKYYNEDFVR